MHGTRRIILLTGDRAWSQATASALIGAHPAHDTLWVGDQIPSQLSLKPITKPQQLLGDEYGIAVIDGWSGFDPDTFGAVSGTIRGGGALLLLVPPLEAWATYPDPAQQRIASWPHTPATMANHFVARTIRLLQACPEVEWLTPMHDPVPPLLLATPQSGALPYRCSAEQRQAVAALHHVVHGHRRRPLVLMADRGRGKSAALGIAASELIAQGMQRIIVTAPHRNALNALFAQVDSAAIEFIPPDELLRHQPPCDLLLVDEAAAIPAPILHQLLQRYGRIAFATTVHGYEGSGRGFALRFFKVLDSETPGWRLLQMREPIRWSEGDALEQLTYRLLLLDAEPAGEEQVVTATHDELCIETLSARELMDNDLLLRELFGLLVLAHYRTTPLDLRQLLDSPTLSIHLARYRGHVVATALTLREGGFDHELAGQIAAGERRPRGHLSPQSLAFHCGFSEAPLLLTERIMRIAVHPALQQRAIGSALLDYLTTQTRHSGIDYLSASFGATPELLHFWQRNGFLPVRLGLTREASSGHHSSLVMRPLSASAMALFARASRRFLDTLPLLLNESLRELEAEMVIALLAGELSTHRNVLDEDDWRDLHAFATTQRSYESCLLAIQKLMHVLLSQPLPLQGLSAEQRQLLVVKVVQRQSWSEVVDLLGVNGKESAVKLLRRAIHALLHELSSFDTH